MRNLVPVLTFKFVLILVCVFTAVPQLAQAGTLISLGANVNYQLDSSGRTYEAKFAPGAVRGGWRFRLLDVFAEYSYRKEDPSGTDMIQVGSENHELLLWGRMAYPKAKMFKPFGAVAVGVHRETVLTSFGAERRTDTGQLEGMVAAAAGLEILFTRHFNLTVEGRMSSAPSYSPNPLFGAASYLGLVF